MTIGTIGAIMQTAKAVAGSKPVVIGLNGLTAAGAASDGYQAIAPDALATKGERTVNALNAGLGATGLILPLLGLGPIGLAVGTGAGVASLVTSAAGDYANASSWYDLDSVFNPSDKHHHMIGLASQKFYDQLEKDETGRIRWEDPSNMARYQALLENHITSLKNNMDLQDSWVPDFVRLYFSPFSSAAADAIVDREAIRSDLKIAIAAERELGVYRQHLEIVLQQREEMLASLLKLTGGEKRETTLADLDRNGNNQLDPNDLIAIRTAIGNDAITDHLLTVWKGQNLHFEGYKLPGPDVVAPELPILRPETLVASREPSLPSISQSIPIPIPQPQESHGGISAFLSGLLNKIAALFTPRRNDTMLAAAPPAPNHPRTVDASDQPPVVPPLLPLAAGAQPVIRPSFG